MLAHSCGLGLGLSYVLLILFIFLQGECIEKMWSVHDKSDIKGMFDSLSLKQLF